MDILWAHLIMPITKNLIEIFIDHVMNAINYGLDTLNNDNLKSSKLFSALKTQGQQSDVIKSEQLPVLDLLPKAIQTASSGPPYVKELVWSLMPILPKLQWYKRLGDYPANFMQGHANAFIIGQKGLEKRGDVTVGITLVAPSLQYPDHSHPPEEIYIVLSDGGWRQGKGSWNSPGLGDLVYNPGNITHSMRASSNPLLAVWCLWSD